MNNNISREKAIEKSIEYYNSKTLKEIYKGLPDSSLRLLKLVEIIPNWETYLTPKQLEVMQKYITCLNASEVDYQLNFNAGTTQQRLFGSSTSKGAYGRLEEVVKRLEKQDYFIKQEKIFQKENENKKVKPSKISDKTKEEIKELIKLIVDMPEYENYLTKSQKERVFQFLRLRSIKSCAKYFNITETTFKQSLLGKNEDTGILGRLRKVASNNMINNWDDI